MRFLDISTLVQLQVITHSHMITSSISRFQDDCLMIEDEMVHNKLAKPKPFKKKKLVRVFSEDYGASQRKILDPRGSFMNLWNKCFLVACLISLFIDPLFFYLPSIEEEMCMDGSFPYEVVLTIIRTVVDMFYAVQIFIRFRTAFVAPSSRVFGRGELVIDPSKIASRYLRRQFWIDLMAALPLPQVLILALIPTLRGSNKISAKNFLRCSIISQFLLRMCLLFPISSQIIKTAGVVVGAAWAGAAYNLLLYMLASHVSTSLLTAHKISLFLCNQFIVILLIGHRFMLVPFSS